MTTINILYMGLGFLIALCFVYIVDSHKSIVVAVALVLGACLGVAVMQVKTAVSLVEKLERLNESDKSPPQTLWRL